MRIAATSGMTEATMFINGKCTNCGRTPQEYEPALCSDCDARFDSEPVAASPEQPGKETDDEQHEATGEPAQRKEAMKAKEFIQKFDAEKDGLWNLPELLEAYCAQVTSQRDAHKQALVEECVRSRSKDEQIRNLEQKVAQRDARIAELEKERNDDADKMSCRIFELTQRAFKAEQRALDAERIQHSEKEILLKEVEQHTQTRAKLVDAERERDEARAAINWARGKLQELRGKVGTK